MGAVVLADKVHLTAAAILRPGKMCLCVAVSQSGNLRLTGILIGCPAEGDLRRVYDCAGLLAGGSPSGHGDLCWQDFPMPLFVQAGEDDAAGTVPLIPDEIRHPEGMHVPDLKGHIARYQTGTGTALRRHHGANKVEAWCLRFLIQRILAAVIVLILDGSREGFCRGLLWRLRHRPALHGERLRPAVLRHGLFPQVLILLPRDGNGLRLCDGTVFLLRIQRDAVSSLRDRDLLCKGSLRALCKKRPVCCREGNAPRIGLFLKQLSISKEFRFLFVIGHLCRDEEGPSKSRVRGQKKALLTGGTPPGTVPPLA